MSFNWNMRFQHVLREGNAYADWLAKHGASMDQDFVTWNACPHQLSPTLLADAMGIVRLRP